MKKLLLSLFVAGIASAATAQTTIYDSVMLDAGYANQTWYSLENDEQGSAPKNNWDLAFNLKDINTPIFTNTVAGVKLWGYPKGTIAAWSTVDTNGLSTWPERYNSDATWQLGAMGNYADPANQFDLDWGVYDLTTHFVTGDSLYIIKLKNGDYKKLWIVSLQSGTFNFKYANLDGSSEQTVALTKASDNGKNFTYYSLQNNVQLKREPEASKWDLLFTQYTGFVPGQGSGLTPYTVTGVLSNRIVATAEVNNVSNVNTYVNWFTANFTDNISEIGYDWKSFNGAGYDIKEEQLFFVKTAKEAIWRVVFTGFESATGKFVFNKTQLVGTHIAGVDKNVATMAMYPNPANGQPVTVVYDFATTCNMALINVYDMAGRMVHTAQLDKSAGLHQYTLSLSNLNAGLYSVTVQTEKGSMQQKLVVQ